jgi:hypothetical protein
VQPAAQSVALRSAVSQKGVRDGNDQRSTEIRRCWTTWQTVLWDGNWLVSRPTDFCGLRKSDCLFSTRSSLRKRSVRTGITIVRKMLMPCLQQNKALIVLEVRNRKWYKRTSSDTIRIILIFCSPVSPYVGDLTVYRSQFMPAVWEEHQYAWFEGKLS